nr:early light-inducible protein homolog [Onoclea sensibilis=sensitive fern, spores, Peptide Partial, 230 aa] [Onoclea sensibilis]
ATSATIRWSSSMMGGARLIVPTSSSSPAAPTTPPSTLRVMCSSNKAPSPPGLLSSLKENVDRSTKQELSRADIERTRPRPPQSSSLSGLTRFTPASTVPWPRSELDRRLRQVTLAHYPLSCRWCRPETINGRMAMVGFVWALVVEKMTGLGVMDQLFNPSTSGLLWFGAVVQLFTLASIIPFVNGESTDARRWGPFNAKAERWNGRLAMVRSPPSSLARWCARLPSSKPK